jgi:predicted  nucleic acid-binding Zn-ribbon protein
MGKRRFRRKKASLEARIREHREKIAQERQKVSPDVGLIRHWEREIEAFQTGIQSAQKRLGEAR